MKQKKALSLAITALEKQRRYHAFDANLYKKGLVTERTKIEVREYDMLTEAIKTLREMLGNIP